MKGGWGESHTRHERDNIAAIQARSLGRREPGDGVFGGLSVESGGMSAGPRPTGQANGRMGLGFKSTSYAESQGRDSMYIK